MEQDEVKQHCRLGAARYAVRVGLAVFVPLLALSTWVALAANSDEGSLLTESYEVAVFAGGCFWCVESDFDHVPGVLRTVSGYTGGHTANPTYKQVGRGDTGHREAVEIAFDANKVSYEQLVEIFWRSIDPTDSGGQFCDRGESYTSAIFATSEQQRSIAEASRQRLETSGVLGAPIATPVETARQFLPRGGLPPGLLREERLSLPPVSIQLRARFAREETLG